MEPQNHREQLEQLHRELSRVPSLDERGQQMLAQVRADLDRLPANHPPGHEAADAHTTLSSEERNQIQSRWQGAVIDFEGSHPQLARGLERMAVILSNFGL